jgi:hypothetical protein
MLEQEPRDAGEGERTPRASEALYTRPMPGGGYVRVELVVSDRGAVASERRRGRVVIEQRALARVGEAIPLVVEELEGDDENEVVEQLFRIARDNAAIARRVLRYRAAMVPRAD